MHMYFSLKNVLFIKEFFYNTITIYFFRQSFRLLVHIKVYIVPHFACFVYFGSCLSSRNLLYIRMTITLTLCSV